MKPVFFAAITNGKLLAFRLDGHARNHRPAPVRRRGPKGRWTFRSSRRGKPREIQPGRHHRLKARLVLEARARRPPPTDWFLREKSNIRAVVRGWLPARAGRGWTGGRSALYAEGERGGGGGGGGGGTEYIPFLNNWAYARGNGHEKNDKHGKRAAIERGRAQTLVLIWRKRRGCFDTARLMCWAKRIQAATATRRRQRPDKKVERYHGDGPPTRIGRPQETTGCTGTSPDAGECCSRGG